MKASCQSVEFNYISNLVLFFCYIYDESLLIAVFFHLFFGNY